MLLVTIKCKTDSDGYVNRTENSYFSQNQTEIVKNSIWTIENEGKEDKARVCPLQGMHTSWDI